MKPSVQFHIIEKLKTPQALKFICERIETLYLALQSIYVYLEDKNTAEHFSNLLWTYKDVSFLPHEIADSDTYHFTAPIKIGFRGSAPLAKANVLINLAKKIPDFYVDFTNILEYVFADQDEKTYARERFKQYRQAQCELSTIKQSNA